MSDGGGGGPIGVLVIGAGAIGSVIAADLARSDLPVTLLARGKRYDLLRHCPVEVVQDGNVTRTRVPVCTWTDVPASVEIVVICTKTGDLAQTLTAFKEHVAPGTVILTLQNGVEAPIQASAILPAASIVAGRLHGFFELDGHQIQHIGVQPSILFGCVQGERERTEATIGAVLRPTRFQAERTADITTALWEKMLITAALGGLAAALRCPAGQVCNLRGGEARLREVMLEVCSVGNALGAKLDNRAIDQQIALIRKFPPNATTSLQRDLQRGISSEYESVVGCILRLSKKVGVSAPAFREIVKAISAS